MYFKYFTHDSCIVYRVEDIPHVFQIFYSSLLYNTHCYAYKKDTMEQFDITNIIFIITKIFHFYSHGLFCLL